MKQVSMVVWNTFQNDARVLKEAETLMEHGYSVTVFALHTPGVTSRQERVGRSGVRVHRVLRSPGMLLRMWARGWRSRRREGGARPAVNASPAPRGPARGFRFFLQMVSRTFTHGGLVVALARSRPDVVHAHDVNTLATAWIAARLVGAKLVYDAHEISTDREGYESIRKMVGWLERRLIRRAHGTITTTEMRAKFFARAHGVDRPLVLQNRPRLMQAVASTRLREELVLSENWPIILYQGGLQTGRGLEDLVKAAKNVTGAYFVFVGGGRIEGALQRLAEELAVSDRVHFIPTVSLDDLPDYTASADIGVQPIRNTCLNHFSTDSNKLFEYAMAGLPIVASDFPEIRRVVTDYDLGILFDPEEPDGLVRSLQELVSSPELRRKYARNARAAAGALSWESQEEALVTLYGHVTGQSAGAMGSQARPVD